MEDASVEVLMMWSDIFIIQRSTTTSGLRSVTITKGRLGSKRSVGSVLSLRTKSSFLLLTVVLEQVRRERSVAHWSTFSSVRSASSDSYLRVNVRNLLTIRFCAP